MNSVTFPDLKNRRYEVAGSFNELTETQLVNIIGLLYATGDEARKKYRMLCELFNFNRSADNTALFKWSLKPIHFVEMFPLTDFIFRDSDLTKNLIPYIRVSQDGKWYGPDDRLNNIAFIEFIKCERYYKKFQKTREVQYIDKLIAVLYRPKKANYDHLKDGDIREKYIDENKLIDFNAKRISKLDINIKLSILHYYTGCRNYIFNSPAYKSVFTKLDNEMKVKEKVKTKDEQSWEKALMNMATNVKDIEDIAQTRCSTVLFHLNEKIESHKRSLEPIKPTTV